MKLVLNVKYGGFALSKAAVELYEIKTGINLTQMDDELWFIHDDPERWDPFLVEVVEELGELSFGEHAALKIVEVEDGRPFRIQEYDGAEGIVYQDQVDWITASPELIENIRTACVETRIKWQNRFSDNSRIGKIYFSK